MLHELDAQNRNQVTYTFGDDLISQDRAQNLNYYHYDGLGSTRSLTDTLGQITDTYDFNAYGTMLDKSGATANSYLYTGEQFDVELDQYYLRARYYNPADGRFTQMDTYQGRMQEPLSLHKYLYTNGSPATNIDPSGNSLISLTMNAVAIAGVTTIVGGIGAILYNDLNSEVSMFKSRRKYYLNFDGMSLKYKNSIVKESALNTLNHMFSAYGVEFKSGAGFGIFRKEIKIWDDSVSSPNKGLLGRAYGPWSASVWMSEILLQTPVSTGVPITSHALDIVDMSNNIRPVNSREIGVGLANVAAHELLHMLGRPNHGSGCYLNNPEVLPFGWCKAVNEISPLKFSDDTSRFLGSRLSQN